MSHFRNVEQKAKTELNSYCQRHFCADYLHLQERVWKNLSQHHHNASIIERPFKWQMNKKKKISD